MKIAEALAQSQSSSPKMKLRDALMQVNPSYVRAKKAEEARINSEKALAEAQKYAESAKFWETIAHPSGALKSIGTEIVGTTKAVGADIVNVLTPWDKTPIQEVQFGGKTFQTPSAKGAEAGLLAREGQYKKAAGKLGESVLDIVSTVTPASITIKALKAGSILRAMVGAGAATAPIGAGYGATSAMQDGAGTGGILKGAATGAGIAFAGGATIGAIPGIIKILPKAISKIEGVIGKLTTQEKNTLKKEITSGKTPEQAVDTVLQSRTVSTKEGTKASESIPELKTVFRGKDATVNDTGSPYRFFTESEESAGKYAEIKKTPGGKPEVISEKIDTSKYKLVEAKDYLDELKNKETISNYDGVKFKEPNGDMAYAKITKEKTPIDTAIPEQPKPDNLPKKESVTAKKMNERFGKDEQLSTEYDVISINRQSDEAAHLISTDKEKAVRTAFNDSGSNTEKIAILNELFEKSVIDKDHKMSSILFNRIKQLSTQTAQSLNMFKALTEVNPHYAYMSEVVSSRLNGVKIGARNISEVLKKESKQDRIRSRVSKQSKELKESLSNSVKFENAQKVFNDLICK